MPEAAEQYIRELAVLVIKQRGQRALSYAADHAEELHVRGDLIGADSWRRVVVEIGHLRNAEHQAP